MQPCYGLAPLRLLGDGALFVLLVSLVLLQRATSRSRNLGRLLLIVLPRKRYV